MEIKNLIKSQKTRHYLMRLGSFLPDRIMIPLQYKLILHRYPDIKNPKRLTEWIQLYKMKYRNPLLLDCVDKYAVRKHVSTKLGGYFNGFVSSM